MPPRRRLALPWPADPRISVSGRDEPAGLRPWHGGRVHPGCVIIGATLIQNKLAGGFGQGEYEDDNTVEQLPAMGLAGAHPAALLRLPVADTLLRDAAQPFATNAEITSLDWVVSAQPDAVGQLQGLFADPFVPMANGFKVSAIITVTTSFEILFALMAGYALARIPDRWSNLVFILIIGTMMMPSDALFVPTYAVVARIGGSIRSRA